MRLNWLKLAGFVAAISLPLVGQNTPMSPGQLPAEKARAQKSPAATRTAGPSKSAAHVAVVSKRSKKKSRVAPVPVPQPEPQPPVVVVPPTPEQLPANPPQVSYLNGQLTIQSSNSTLSAILNAIKTRTGAQFEIPPGSGAERVATRIGPASPRDVIASLLSGSSFDYIILGSPNSPGGVDRVILTAKGRGAAPGGNVAGAPPATAAPAVVDSGDEETETSDAGNDATDEAPPEVSGQPGSQPGAQPGPPQQQPSPQVESPVIAAQPPAAPGGEAVGQQPPAGPGAAPAGGQQPPPGPGGEPAGGQPPAQAQPSPEAPAPNAQQGNSGQPQVKTPEQFLQELQKMQQQQQQQQKQ